MAILATTRQATASLSAEATGVAVAPPSLHSAAAPATAPPPTGAPPPLDPRSNLAPSGGPALHPIPVLRIFAVTLGAACAVRAISFSQEPSAFAAAALAVPPPSIAATRQPVAVNLVAPFLGGAAARGPLAVCLPAQGAVAAADSRAVHVRDHAGAAGQGAAVAVYVATKRKRPAATDGTLAAFLRSGEAARASSKRPQAAIPRA